MILHNRPAFISPITMSIDSHQPSGEGEIVPPSSGTPDAVESSQYVPEGAAKPPQKTDAQLLREQLDMAYKHYGQEGVDKVLKLLLG
ncbi:hypothetical protein COU80_03520 [Candidatus Peregrinibacteria bacterium CG10_big_fil_rev_8_21_14_0_10_55_24]|nr:MAG: hypothetical protein COU80_03520 [Candidatus Peregrinibacteria bacterium CG10_big_fil_rev_8_21_14_0_10_55_24]